IFSSIKRRKTAQARRPPGGPCVRLLTMRETQKPPMNVSAPVVELRSAQKVYGLGKSEVVGLAGVGLTIAASEYVAVVGTSGSGKSTLLNIVGTLDRLDEGTYRIDGTDVAGLADAELSALRCTKIGFVFQAFHLLPLHTALENVELPMVYSRVPRAERRGKA